MHQYIGKIVQLIYIDGNREVSIRNVRVIATDEAKFMAYCYQANEVRTFKISGVVGMERVNKRALEVI